MEKCKFAVDQMLHHTATFEVEANSLEEAKELAKSRAWDLGDLDEESLTVNYREILPVEDTQ